MTIWRAEAKSQGAEPPTCRSLLLPGGCDLNVARAPKSKGFREDLKIRLF